MILSGCGTGLVGRFNETNHMRGLVIPAVEMRHRAIAQASRSVDRRITLRARSGEIESPLLRHARACRGHPRLSCGTSASKTWMAGTSPATTPEKWFKMIGTGSNSNSSAPTTLACDSPCRSARNSKQVSRTRHRHSQSDVPYGPHTPEGIEFRCRRGHGTFAMSCWRHRLQVLAFHGSASALRSMEKVPISAILMLRARLGSLYLACRRSSDRQTLPRVWLINVKRVGAPRRPQDPRTSPRARNPRF
jgi:hypothetical protein